jgi:hypothetical protein
MRNRIEDLGRIYEIIKDTLEQDIYYSYFLEEKDIRENFMKKPDHEQQQILETLISGIFYSKERLYEILSIAAGEDDLNYIDFDKVQ